MAKKQYRCKNGDLIEAGKYYSYTDPKETEPCKVKVSYVASLRSNWPISMVVDEGFKIYEAVADETMFNGLWVGSEENKEPEREVCIKEIKYILQSDEYLSQVSFDRLKEQIKGTNFEDRTLLLEKIKLIEL